MLDYIKKFNKLPKQLRDKVSTPAVMSAIEKLEKKYNVNLATVVMKIMVKEVDVNQLADRFTQEFNLDKAKAEQLAKELKEEVLSGVADYLGMTLDDRRQTTDDRRQTTDDRRQTTVNTQKMKPIPFTKESNSFFSDEDEAEIKELAKNIDPKAESSLSDDEIEKQLDKILAQAQINFGSEELVARFRKILKIYLRGIRDRIDTKQTLIKPIDAGGLSFDQESTEQILKITDSNKTGQMSDTALLKKIKAAKTEKGKAIGPKESGFASLSRSGVRDIDYDLSSLPDKKSFAIKEQVSVPIDAEDLSGKKAAEAEDEGAKIKYKPINESLAKLDTERELAPPPPKLRPALSGFQRDEKYKQASSPLALPQKVKPKEASPVRYKKLSNGASPVRYLPRLDKPRLDKLSNRGKLSNGVKLSNGASPVSHQTKEKFAVAEPRIQTGKPEAEVEKEQEIKTKPIQEVKQIDSRKVDEATGKIKMEDVKVKFAPPPPPQGPGAGLGRGKPKVMGPIDELKYMDLISFRRLDKEPVEIITKIKEKISLLEEEDYTKRLQGIKAWRAGSVNKLYLEMGQDSISESKPIDVIIEERKAAGKEYLNSKEFEAVTDLNKSLRF